MKFLFCSHVLARFLRVWICYGWISGCVVQFYHAIFEVCGPRTGGHTGIRIDIRPCFGGWRATYLCGLLVAIFLLKKERGDQLLHNIFGLQILFENCYQQSTKMRYPLPTKEWSYINTCAGVTAGLNNLVRDLGLTEEKSELLSSRLKQWKMLQKGVNYTYFSISHASL